MARRSSLPIRGVLLAASLVGVAAPAWGQVTVGLTLPGLSIGLDVPDYPQLELVPGYPVYFDPHASSNYFFYDGLFWVYVDDTWYSSSWYDGPWQRMDPREVPLYVLRVPVEYYREPPRYFQGWRPDAPPRWGERWGQGWERQHPGWDRFDRRQAPRPAPLPLYQQQYRGDRYPRALEQQHDLRDRNYRHQPREAVTRERFEQRGPGASPGERPPPASVPKRLEQPPPPRGPDRPGEPPPPASVPKRLEQPPPPRGPDRPGEPPPPRPAERMDQRPMPQPTGGPSDRMDQRPPRPAEERPAPSPTRPTERMDQRPPRPTGERPTPPPAPEQRPPPAAPAPRPQERPAPPPPAPEQRPPPAAPAPPPQERPAPPPRAQERQPEQRPPPPARAPAEPRGQDRPRGDQSSPKHEPEGHGS